MESAERRQPLASAPAPADAPPAARARALAARLPWVLGALVLGALALRVLYALVYRPAVLNLADSTVYLDMAQNTLFSDPSRSVGYSLLLRGLHAVWADVWLAIAFQHLLGIATGLLLYATVRRLGAPVWAAAIAAAAVLLSLDQVFLEHALMPETAFTFAGVASLYACVRALEPPRPLWGPLTTRVAWAVGAGAALGLSAWLRPVTVPLIPFLALWLLFGLQGAWRSRVGVAAAAVAATLAVLLGYFGLNAGQTGHFGLTEASGWALYSRVAPFADCSRFDPPAGTARLCQSTPADQRPGPDYYGWQPGSPARQVFGAAPAGDDRLSAFARAAIVHQPGSYLSDVARDSARYFVAVDAPPYSGVGYELVDVDRRAPGLEEQMVASINSYYDDEQATITGGVDEVGAIQDVLSIRSKFLLVALVLGVVGVFLASGPLRAGLVLLVGSSLLLMLVPVATAIYSARYAIPATGPLVAAGAIGAWLIAVRLGPRLRSLRGRPAG